jgi:hypothetical protein
VGGGPDPVVERLLDVVRAASAGESRLVVLLGDAAPAARTADEVLGRDDVRGLWSRWWRPASPEDLVAGLRTPFAAGPWTVVRLDHLARFLLPADDDLAATVASALRGALEAERLRPLLVVASLDPDPRDWSRLTRPAASGGTMAAAQAQALRG